MILSKKCGRPVKLQNSREEVFQSTGPAAGMSASLKVGVTKEGKLTAVSGAYNFRLAAIPDRRSDELVTSHFLATTFRTLI